MSFYDLRAFDDPVKEAYHRALLIRNKPMPLDQPLYRYALYQTQGEALANESVTAVQGTLHDMPGPDGVNAFLTGPAVVLADQQIAGDRSMRLILLVTFAVIVVMLLVIYGSVTTALVVLAGLRPC